ncbi:MAG: 16S rRNA (guanine(966)-N(2))-methyltransferase RsmD [Spirochaetales bacterium]|nr:16S rRNA (guanine(966)-N(2))-methyltransferase RsmD [Spirochaetales bacterium]
MRITGGYYKGRKIVCPKGIIRPAMDRMRESLFAITGDISGCSFLDLFSGSGVVGIEAASRGAEPVILVEKDSKKINALKRNISFIHTEIKIVLTPVELFLKRCKDRFDFIYADPPFAYKYKKEMLSEIALRSMLNESGLLILHCSKDEKLPETIESMTLTDKRTYGGSVLHFYGES